MTTASSAPGPAPLRVLYVLNYPARGGPATSLSTLLRHFPPGAVSVHVYSPGRAASELFEEIGVPVSEGPVSVFTHFQYFVYRGRDWLFFVRELLLLPLHLAAFAFTLWRVPCDIVHLNEANLFAAAVLARGFGKRVVCHVRSALPARDHGLRSRAMRWAYRRLMDRLIAIESATLRPLEGIPNALIINNPVDVERFRSAMPAGLRESLGIAGDEIVVALAGRASPDEGLEDIVEAAAIACERHAGLRFVWIGASGPPTSAAPPLLFRMARVLGLGTGQFDHVLRERIRQRGLGVRFLLAPYQRDIWGVMREVDIVVTGGRSGLGRQALEAGAAGKPVVGLSDDPRPDLIEDGVTGFVVPIGEARVLAERLLTLALDPALRERLGEAGRRLSCERAEPARVAAQLLEVYRGVVKGSA